MISIKTSLAIIGPTASGKSRLAIEIAKKIKGEIIGLDSRQIYKGMSIGTAQLTKEEQDGIPHHLVGIISPIEPISAGAYSKLVLDKIKDIQSRNHVPIICGGSGLYYRSLIRGIFKGSKSDLEVRKKLEDGVADATFLACAGLIRLGMEDLVNPISPEVMMPAIAQGIIGIEQRLNDNEITELLLPLNHEQTKTQALVERAFLQVLDGSCRTPIGSISIIDGKKIIFSGQVLKPDGTEIISGNWEGLVGNPKDLGKMAGNEIKEKIDDSFFKQENFSH